MDGARILERWNFRYTRRMQEHVPFLFGVCVLYAYAPSAYHRWDSRINRKSVTVARKSKPILTTPAALIARALLCMRTHDNYIKFSFAGHGILVAHRWWLEQTQDTIFAHKLSYTSEMHRWRQHTRVNPPTASFADPPVHPYTSVYFCVCSDVFTYIYIIIYMCMYLHRLHTYICSHKYTPLFFFLSLLKNWNWNWIYMYIYTHMHVSICIQPDWRTLLYIHSCVPLCLYVYVFIYIHTCVTTHTRYTCVCI